MISLLAEARVTTRVTSSHLTVAPSQLLLSPQVPAPYEERTDGAGGGTGLKNSRVLMPAFQHRSIAAGTLLTPSQVVLLFPSGFHEPGSPTS